jgi:hypothetical protein
MSVAAGQITGLSIVARLERPSGQAAYVTIPVERLVKALSADATLGSVLTRAAGAASDAIADGKLIAVLGIGFGPPPAEESTWPLWKGEFDEDEHPRWPAGAPEGRGGQFRAKDADEPEQPDDGSGTVVSVLSRQLIDAVRREAVRTAVRTGALLLLRLTVASLAEAVPVIGQAVGVLEAADAIRTLAEARSLKAAYDEALEFAKGGPRTLEQLRVSDQNLGFSNFQAFKKSPVEKYFGAAPDGWEYHHIVEQNSAEAQNIPPEQVHNSDLVIRLPKLLHEAVNAEYQRKNPDTGMSLRDWLKKQPFEVQREEGLKVLRKLGILT